MPKKPKTKKAAPKPKHARLRSGDFATVTPDRPDPIRLVPLYVDIRLDRTDAHEVANLLDIEADRLYDAAEKLKSELSASAWIELQGRAESLSMIAQGLYRKLDPHHEIK